MAASFQERTRAEMRRGVLQVSALALLTRRAYGYDLLRLLGRRGLSVEEGTLYPILRRLESKGLLESSWDTSGSRPRKYYETTDEGRAALAELFEEWNRIDTALRQIVESTAADDEQADREPDPSSLPG